MHGADPGYTPGKDIYHPLPPHAQGWQLAGLVGGGGDASTPAYTGLTISRR